MIILASELYISFQKLAPLLTGDHVLFIPDACYGEGFEPDYNDHQGLFAALGMTVTDFELKGKTPEETKAALDKTDILYMGPGHTFYLHEHMKKSGLFDCIPSFLDRGGIYIGSSAGSIVASPDIAFIAPMDDPRPGDLDDTKALGLIDKPFVPHKDHVRMGKAAAEIAKNNPDAIVLNDNEALIIQGKKTDIIQS